MICMAIFMISIFGIYGCATTNTQSGVITAQRTYASAQQIFINAWNTYHSAFITQTPDVKAQWTKEYHPLFLKATKALDAWSLDQTSLILSTNANQAIDALTTIILKIKK